MVAAADVAPLGAGLGLAVGLILLGRLTGFGRERSYYPMLVLVIASYYPLFAFMAGQNPMLELACAAAFMALALGPVIWGQAWILVGVALVAHGLFDLWLPGHAGHAAGPVWWAPFCAAVDLPLGLWVIWLYARGPRQPLGHALS